VEARLCCFTTDQNRANQSIQHETQETVVQRRLPYSNGVDPSTQDYPGPWDKRYTSCTRARLLHFQCPAPPGSCLTIKIRRNIVVIEDSAGQGTPRLAAACPRLSVYIQYQKKTNGSEVTASHEFRHPSTEVWTRDTARTKSLEYSGLLTEQRLSGEALLLGPDQTVNEHTQESKPLSRQSGLRHRIASYVGRGVASSSASKSGTDARSSRQTSPEVGKTLFS
jgi:hypothetical protein